MLSLILMLIVAVAAFNLVSSLVMTVTQKQGDIAILRTLGAPPGSIMKIFAIQDDDRASPARSRASRSAARSR